MASSGPGTLDAADPLLGRKLGEYTLVERIGEGGFGKVYRAHQAALSREAVVKVLHLASGTDETVSRRFIAEAQVASRLDHPYAAHVYGFGAESDGLLWIAMELVRGSPLDVHLLVNGPLKLERCVPLFERVCEVVHTAHEQGIVHRDLKPANIMVLSRAGRLLPKLLDFGIAKVLSAVSSSSPGVVGRSELHSLVLVESPATHDFSLERTAPMATQELSLEHTAPQTPASESGLRRLEITNPSVTDNEILGSPRYMAPEQWVSPRDIDARTDQYALAAVAYEALTGKPAFDGHTVAALLLAHERGIPKLPPGFPDGLDAVLARATANEPADRYPSVLELAEAFRTAAGLRSERNLPQLERSIRDRFVERAPEPVADAIVALETAASVHAMRDGIAHVARTLATWLGLVAMSARTRIGPSGGDSEGVQTQLRQLRRDGLRDVEWLKLARDLVRPFEQMPEQHPIPELVACLLPRAGELDGFDSIKRLLEVHASTQPTEAQLRTRLPDLLQMLRDALASVWFLTEYELVVPQARGPLVDRFSGARRIPRSTRARPDAEHAGQPILLDADGIPVLVLAPLVQCAPPTNGADCELFVLEGPGRHGARLVAPRHAFEIHDATLWEWFSDQLLADARDNFQTAASERPYRGLETFTMADSHLFFGREREVDSFVNRVRVTPLVAVVGPSGAGKSSFVQAGALPALGWRTLILRPGSAPLSALASRLDGRVTVAELRDRPERLGDVLRADPGVGTVLAVDQLEELFTLCSDPVERDAFARALSSAARSVDDRVRVIVTLRDDFLMRAEGIPALHDRLATGLHLLGTPKRDDLIRILVEPARQAGYAFEDDTLAAEMVDAVADRPGALALLSFTAAALWELRDRHFRHLPRKAYRAIGGVGGALARHAEETLTAMLPEQRGLVREAFRRLVTADGTRAVLSRAELVQVLGGGAKAEAVIEALVGARLLAASESEQGELVEVTHEALLSEWPRLVEWRREDAEGARLRDQLRTAAAQWHERGRPDGLLWRGDALVELEQWQKRTTSALTDVEAAFTAAALREKLRGRRLRRGMLAAVVGFLICALAGALWLNSQTKRERARAVRSLAALHQEQGRLALLSGRPATALVYLAEAYKLGARGAALQIMIAAAARPVEAARFTLEGHAGSISLAYSHDGHRIATAANEGDVRVWDAGNGSLLHVLRGHAKAVRAVAFSPDNTQLATASWDGSCRLWDAASGRTLHTLQLGHAGIALAYSPDGSRIVTAAGDVDDTGGARIWDVRTGALVSTLDLQRHTGAVAWSADGQTIATGSVDGARLWNAATSELAGPLEGTRNIFHLAFTPDGSRLATADRDRSFAIWDTRRATKLVDLVGQASKVRGISVTPDGRYLVAASSDNSVRMWELSTGKLARLLEGNAARVLVVALSRTGDRLVAGSADGTARVWDVASGALLAVRDGHSSAIVAAAFGADGNDFVTGTADGSVKVWRATDARTVSRDVDGRPEHVEIAADGRIATGGRTSPPTIWSPRLEALRTFGLQTINPSFSFDGTLVATPTHDDRIRIWRSSDGVLLQTLEGQPKPLVARFSSDGRRLASASEGDGTVRIWQLDGSRPTIVLEHPMKSTSSVAFSPDDRRVVTAGRDGGVRIWDASSGRLEATLAFTKGWVMSASFDHEGARIVSAHQEGVAAIWDARTRVRLGVLEGHAREVSNARFSKSGDLVVTASGDSTVRVWDAKRFKLLLVLAEHRAEVIDAAFTADEAAIVSASWDGTVRRWEVARDRRTPSEIDRLVQCLSIGVDANGSISPRTAVCN